MGFFASLFGNSEASTIERYRYVVRTAPAETIEQVHAEAFAKLTDAQRAVIYEEFSRGAGTGERPLSSEPATLARAATRAELRNPGSLERSFGRSGFGGQGLGATIGGSLLGTVAGYVIGSALVSAFLPWDDGGAADASSAAGDDAGTDTASWDDGMGDLGGDFGF